MKSSCQGFLILWQQGELLSEELDVFLPADHVNQLAAHTHTLTSFLSAHCWKTKQANSEAVTAGSKTSWMDTKVMFMLLYVVTYDI